MPTMIGLIEFVRHRDGMPAAVAYAAQSYRLSMAALKEGRRAGRGYGRAYRGSLVRNCMACRQWLRALG